MDENLEALINVVDTVRHVDPQTVARTETLGKALDFSAAVPLVQRIVELFNQMPTRHFIDLPDSIRRNIKSEADAFVTAYAALMEFDPAKSSNATAERNSHIDNIRARYEQSFAQLMPVAAYLSSKELDFKNLEDKASEVIRAAEVESLSYLQELKKTQADAQRVLTEVRSVAAEAGVSQQATYFGDEAGRHETAATNWQRYTVFTAIGLGAFAFASLLVGIYWVPSNTYQALQIGLAKLLIFTTIASMLLLCSKTLLAHRHNAIVNKHRQNALLTFNALADAAQEGQTRDVVLTHASACIYEPQDSGFTKPSGSSQSVIEVLPKLVQAGGSS